MKKLLSCLLVVLMFISCLTVSAGAASYTVYKTIDTSKAQLANDGGLGIGLSKCDCAGDTFKSKLVSGSNVVKISSKNGMLNVTYRKSGSGIYKLTCAKGHTTYVKIIVRPFEITSMFDMSKSEITYEMSIRDWYVNTKTATVPSKVNGQKVTCIQPKCFSGNDKIEVIKIPSSVKYIQKSAFDNCKNLKKVIINGKTFTKKNLYKIWKSSTWKGYSHGITELPSKYSIYKSISGGEPAKGLYEYFN